MTTGRLPVLVLALALAADAVSAQEPEWHEDLIERHAEAVRAVVPALDELATWAGRKRLGARRDELCETILALAPEHPRARKTLGWRRDRDGAWFRKESYRAGRDRGERHLAELAERRAEIVREFREPLIECIDTGGPARGSGAALELALIWADLIALDPNDERARAERGEELDSTSGAWLLAETLRARERRGELRAALEEIALELPEPRALGVRARDRALPLDWQAAVQTPNVLLVGTMDERSLGELARQAEAAIALYALAVGRDLRPSAGFVVYALGADQDREALLGSHPGFDPEARAAARQFDSSWIPGTTELVLWPASWAQQSDHLVRQCVALMLSSEHHVPFERGWVYEGFATWLSELATGESLTSHVTPRRFAPGAEPVPSQTVLGQPVPGEPVPGEPDSLLAAARRAADSYGGPGLSEVLVTRTVDMGPEERALSYALARHLGEGHPAELHRLLSLQGLDRPSVRALEDAVGCELAILERRFERWLEETAGPAGQ